MDQILPIVYFSLLNDRAGLPNRKVQFVLAIGLRLAIGFKSNIFLDSKMFYLVLYVDSIFFRKLTKNTIAWYKAQMLDQFENFFKLMQMVVLIFI